MKKRLLASLLSLAMVATMMPAALADDETAGGEKSNKPNFAIDSADALSVAIAGAKGDDYTIALDTNITSAVSIPKDKNIVLDLKH